VEMCRIRKCYVSAVKKNRENVKSNVLMFFLYSGSISFSATYLHGVEVCWQCKSIFDTASYKELGGYEIY
jgi:hypothetical protein